MSIAGLCGHRALQHRVRQVGALKIHRFEVRGALLIQTLGVLPLIMPPFVGAVALQLIFGRSGSVNLLLNEHLGFTVPIMDGLVGVTFVESIHYFPFILLNLVALAVVLRIDNENRTLMHGGRV